MTMKQKMLPAAKPVVPSKPPSLVGFRTHDGKLAARCDVCDKQVYLKGNGQLHQHLGTGSHGCLGSGQFIRAANLDIN